MTFASCCCSAIILYTNYLLLRAFRFLILFFCVQAKGDIANIDNAQSIREMFKKPHTSIHNRQM